MKKIITFIFLLVSTICYGQNQHVGQFVVELANFGGSPANSDNKAAFVSAIAIASAHTGGGAVHLGGTGVWKTTGGINLPCNVTLYGDNTKADTIQSIASDTLFVNYNTVLDTRDANGTIHDLTFFGNGGTGKSAMAFYLWYWFHFYNIQCYGFSNTALYMKAGQQGLIENSVFQHSGNGVVLDTNSALGILPNQVQFVTCEFWYNTTWGYQVTALQYSAILENCNFISNGTAHNLNTGDAYVGQSEFSGASFKDVEVEEPVAGTTLFYLGPCSGGSSGNITTHYLQDCILLGTTGDYGISTGAPTNTTKLVIQNSTISNDSIDIELTSGFPLINFSHSYFVTTNYSGNQFEMATCFKYQDYTGIEFVQHLSGLPSTHTYGRAYFIEDSALSVSASYGFYGDNGTAFHPIGTNIYNTNGTLTGNRTLTLGGNTLAFSGLVGPPSTFAAIVHSTASDSGTYQVPMSYGSAIASTYVPLLTNTTNITNSTLESATFTRVANIVHGNIGVLLTATTSATTTVLTFTLPVTTSNGSQLYVGSAAIETNVSGTPAYTSGIISIVSTTTGTLTFLNTTSVGSGPVNIIFDYSL